MAPAGGKCRTSASPDRFPEDGKAALPLKLGVSSALIPLGTAVVPAAAFSYGPARAAARAAPSEALRYE
ncbi:MAG TPA: hypothetical protein PK207_06425 [Candidatus Aminicenantes bacterium]|nr:hypothetical protein [Candidatus Aminicenantes bacterium]